MKSGWEHQERKRCFLFPLAFTAVSAQYFLIGRKSACELPIKITLKTIWNMTYLWDHDHITLICEGVSFLHFFLGKWERALFSVHFVMYGIKQASNLVKMIYTSHTWNYFPPFILWCGARKAVNKSLTFPTRVLRVWNHWPEGCCIWLILYFLAAWRMHWEEGGCFYARTLSVRAGDVYILFTPLWSRVRDLPILWKWRLGS